MSYKRPLKNRFCKGLYKPSKNHLVLGGQITNIIFDKKLGTPYFYIQQIIYLENMIMSTTNSRATSSLAKISRTFIAYLGVIIILFNLGSCTVQKSLVEGEGKEFYGYSWEEEKNLGAQADKQIQQQFGVYQDSAVIKYVQNIGQNVLKNSDIRGPEVPEKFKNTEFHFRVLDSPIINAFALPGGYVYMTRGLMSHLNNEAQFSMVMGHEIAHVIARHGSKQAFQQKLGNIALVGGSILGQQALGIPAGDLMNLGGATAQIIYSSYSRSMESQADKLGVKYSAKTGYDASEGAAFFETLQRLGSAPEGLLPQLLQSHPDPGQREQRIPKLDQKWEKMGFNRNELRKDQYMNAINGMVFGNDPRQGFTENNTFLHPGLAFKFPVPTGWQVQNQPTRVILAAPEQNAVMLMELDANNNTVETSVRTFAGQQGMNMESSGAASSNGLDAYQAIVDATDQQGRQMRIYVYALEYDSNIYRFVGFTSKSAFDSYKNAFTQTTSGFDELTDQKVLTIKPARINITAAERTDKLINLIPEELPTNVTPDDIAILNQLDLNDTVEKGTKIKLPVQ